MPGEWWGNPVNWDSVDRAKLINWRNMNRYRKLESMEAVQYTGEPLPGITCEGTPEQRNANGCDNTRAHLPHIHSKSMGGLDVVKPGDWIMPVLGGPFCRVPDGMFRQHFEVPGPVEVVVPVVETAPLALPDPTPAALEQVLGNIAQASVANVDGQAGPQDPTVWGQNSVPPTE